MGTKENVVLLEGNLGKDAKSYPLTDDTGDCVVLELAVNNSSKDNKPTWVRCLAFGTVAEEMKKIGLEKGKRVRIEGELRQNRKDKKTFVKIHSGKLIAKKRKQ